MPRKSKVARSRIKNLGSNAQLKKPTLTVEEDDGFDHCEPPNQEEPDERMYQEGLIVHEEDGSLTLVGFLDDFEDEPLPDLANDLDSESDDEDDESPVESYPEIQELSVLKQFSKILTEAQRIAVEAEDERLKENNRAKIYLKNSARTKRRHKQIAKDLEKQGYLPIKTWFTKAKSPEVEVPSQLEVTSNNQDADVEMVGVDGEAREGQESILSAGESDAVSTIFKITLVSLIKYYQSIEEIEIVPNIEMDPTSEAREKVKELLQELREGRKPMDDTPPTRSDILLDQLNYKDLPKLRRACAALTVKSKDKKIDILFRGRLTGMVGTLNLYLDSQLSYTWREASLIASKSQGHGVNHARNLRMWIHQFLGSGKLPFHRCGRLRVDDEDFAHAIQIHLSGIAKNNYIRAQDIVDFMETPEMQERLHEIGSKKKKISLRTAQRWLHRMGWRYGRKRNGMYVDGHEREDIVEYRTEFIKRWKIYDKRMYSYDNDGNREGELTGFPVPPCQRFRLILLTHDESTFYETDRRKTVWAHRSEKAVPLKKGEGISLMPSDFLTVEWGRLQSEDGTE